MWIRKNYDSWIATIIIDFPATTKLLIALMVVGIAVMVMQIAKIGERQIDRPNNF
jgi:hypothetical protein